VRVNQLRTGWMESPAKVEKKSKSQVEKKRKLLQDQPAWKKKDREVTKKRKIVKTYK
jgi:hypothetical protein